MNNNSKFEDELYWQVYKEIHRKYRKESWDSSKKGIFRPESVNEERDLKMDAEIDSEYEKRKNKS